MRETLASAGADERIRSPISGWRRRKRDSSSVSGSGLRRIESGIASLPTSCSSAASARSPSSSAERPSCRADRPHELDEVG